MSTSDIFNAYRKELDQAMEGDDVPSGHYLRLDVVETISETAVPLPRNVFDGERDRRWVVNREAGIYERLP